MHSVVDAPDSHWTPRRPDVSLPASSPSHTFKDEWLLKALHLFPHVGTAVLDRLRKKKIPFLSQALVQTNLVNEEQLAQAVESLFRVRYVNRMTEMAHGGATHLFNEKLCRRYVFVPLAMQGGNVIIAAANPLDGSMLTDIEMACGKKPIPYFCIPERVECLIWQLYNSPGVIQDLLHRFERDDTMEFPEPLTGVPDGRATVIQLLNAIIERAVRAQASDIHIEHDETSSVVRYRVDGNLRHVRLIPQTIGKTALVSRVKIIADLDITVRHRPQDGRAKTRVDGAEIGLRVSILPTKYGEKAVIRILDRRAAEVPFESLGFSPTLAGRLESILKMEQGVLLVTGPTGSGKTTTLYSMLNRIKSGGTNIVTIEDPIEYRLDNINQVQVNDKQGLQFATVLRSVLRQDPDVIMVGEIRDRETADVSFQAALTGHLVFTTVHANDTISTLSRLIDMGVERFKIAPALLAITAQRLVRRLCPECRALITHNDVDPVIISILKSYALPTTYYRAVGCMNCDWTGYKGRLGLLEYLEIDQPLREKISTGGDDHALREFATKSGSLITMTADALWHLSHGDTTLAEITPYVEIDRQTFERAEKKAAGDLLEIVRTSSGPGAASRILVADEDHEVRAALRQAFEATGCDVLEAKDGDEVLHLMSYQEITAIVADLALPGKNALALLRVLRDDKKLRSIAMIVTSSLDDQTLEIETFSAGASEYLLKPLRPAVVAARTQAVLRRTNVHLS